MDKSQKEATVNALHEKMAKAKFAAAVTFTKLDANTAIELRRAMRASNIDYKVVKNTLALRAAQGTSVEKIAEHFAGPVAVALAYDDVVAPAKAIVEFFKKAPTVLQVKGAVVEGTKIDAAGVEALSKMPGLPETRATLLAMLNTPATTLLRLVKEPGSRVARIIKANADKQEKAA